MARAIDGRNETVDAPIAQRSSPRRSIVPSPFRDEVADNDNDEEREVEGATRNATRW